MSEQKRKLTVAVDFDGTLCENAWPLIGEPKDAVIETVKAWQQAGCKTILWTNRTSERLHEAVRWCEGHGLIFDAVNANLPEVIEAFGGDTRKIVADIYLDDKAVNARESERMYDVSVGMLGQDDAVDHPAHYTQGGIECIDALKAAVAELKGIQAVCAANAIKYIWRFNRKNGAEDLRKAIWYLQRLLTELETEDEEAEEGKK